MAGGEDQEVIAGCWAHLADIRVDLHIWVPHGIGALGWLGLGG